MVLGIFPYLGLSMVANFQVSVLIIVRLSLNSLLNMAWKNTNFSQFSPSKICLQLIIKEFAVVKKIKLSFFKWHISYYK